VLHPCAIVQVHNKT